MARTHLVVLLVSLAAAGCSGFRATRGAGTTPSGPQPTGTGTSGTSSSSMDGAVGTGSTGTGARPNNTFVPPIGSGAATPSPRP